MRATTEISQPSTSCPSARDQLEYIASRDHHGVILRSQASAIGMTRSQIDRRVRRCQWISGPARGGLILAEFATNPASILLAAVTVLNGLAWGRSALALWKLADHPAKPSVAISKRAQGSNIDILSLRDLGDLHRTTRHGIATVSLDVAIAASASSGTQPSKPIVDGLPTLLGLVGGLVVSPGPSSDTTGTGSSAPSPRSCIQPETPRLLS